MSFSLGCRELVILKVFFCIILNKEKMILRKYYPTIVLSDIHLGNISIVKDYLLKTRQGKRYFVTHGDIFDTVTTHMRWLAMLGDVGYTFLKHDRSRGG